MASSTIKCYRTLPKDTYNLQARTSVDVIMPRNGFIFIGRRAPDAPNLEVNTLFSIFAHIQRASKIVDDGATKNVVTVEHVEGFTWRITNNHNIAVYYCCL